MVLEEFRETVVSLKKSFKDLEAQEEALKERQKKVEETEDALNEYAKTIKGNPIRQDEYDTKKEALADEKVDIARENEEIKSNREKNKDEFNKKAESVKEYIKSTMKMIEIEYKGGGGKKVIENKKRDVESEKKQIERSKDAFINAIGGEDKIKISSDAIKGELAKKDKSNSAAIKARLAKFDSDIKEKRDKITDLDKQYEELEPKALSKRFDKLTSIMEVLDGSEDDVPTKLEKLSPILGIEEEKEHSKHDKEEGLNDAKEKGQAQILETRKQRMSSWSDSALQNIVNNQKDVDPTIIEAAKTLMKERTKAKETEDKEVAEKDTSRVKSEDSKNESKALAVHKTELPWYKRFVNKIKNLFHRNKKIERKELSKEEIEQFLKDEEKVNELADNDKIPGGDGTKIHMKNFKERHPEIEEFRKQLKVEVPTMPQQGEKTKETSKQGQEEIER